MYIVHCTMYSVHCKLYTLQYTLYTIHCTLYTVHCTPYTVPNPAAKLLLIDLLSIAGDVYTGTLLYTYISA